jgi:hypothetical protein
MTGVIDGLHGCDDQTAADVAALADRLDLAEDEVVRRLVQLGLEDVDALGDDVVRAAAPTP